MAIRFVLYGLLGWCAEVVWSAVTEKILRQQRDWRLLGHTSLWMFPLYGLLAPLYEPLHDFLRPWHWFMRGVIYLLGIWLVEYITGWLLRKLTGKCPWDYSELRGNLHGLIAWEYAPVWFAAGLLLEPVHGFFVRLTPAIRSALGLGG
ncbi:putative ABC transporter permease [Acidobacteriia bacterium AH_259_A11_L15]|nr:putative ABC transporter permease [Acidobacteriia bacterium AH_259_A11_L15]